MRKQAEISKLTDTAMRTTFPRASREFERFERALRELVHENFGYEAQHGLQYDPEEGHFYFEYRSFVAAVGANRFYCERTFIIDPAKDLRFQFEKVKGEIEEFKGQNNVGRHIRTTFPDTSTI